MAKKKTERQKLTERADREMSRYIRLFHSDENGTCQCVTCGELDYWQKGIIQMGHFANKGSGATRVRWTHHNCFPQCKFCNCFSGPMRPSNKAQVSLVRYTDYIREELGDDIKDDLISRKFEIAKYTEDEIKEIGDLYKEFADKLLKEKGL